MSSSPHPGELAGTTIADVVPIALLADETCRAVLRILPTLPQPASVATLASHVTAVTRNRTLGDLPASELESVELSLHHRELPKLERAGIVNHDHEAGEVSLVQRFDNADEVLEDLDTSVDSGTWDAFTAIRNHGHRHRIVEELAACDGGLSRMALAEAIFDAEGGNDEDRPDDATLTAVELRLHHADLPKLAAAGVLTYDTQTAMVEPADTALIDDLTA